MAIQKFSIQKQIFEIQSFSKTHVHELQNRISHLVNFSLSQKMETYFDEVIPSNLLFRIDQLDLDLGQVNWDTLDSEIEEKLMNALKTEFAERLTLAKSTNYRSISGISVETPGQGRLELFEYYLLYGLLPWYAENNSRFDIEELLHQLYSESRPALKTLIQKTGKNQNVRRRICFQFNDKSIRSIIFAIEPTEAEFIFQTHKQIINTRELKLIVKSEEKDLSRTIWLFIMDFLLTEMSSEFERKMFVKSNLDRIAAYFNINFRDLLGIFYAATEANENAELNQPFRTILAELFTPETESILPLEVRFDNGQTSEKYGYRQQPSEILKKQKEDKMKAAQEEDMGKENQLNLVFAESIYIGNAGLVLFHPYLETYFNRTGLMENKGFTGKASRNRAILLLQYLATGNTEHAEHELVLNKILCNVPLEEAIPVSFTATEQEVQVTKELLEVFIERWDKLKNTSVDGLRNSFIQRDGRLNFTEDHWSLRVEQRGYDILLQSLPWAYSYIKTSWMPFNLIVEWI